ncbi:MAG: response regulator transcription factor [Bdellovibrionia bacterium]
MTASRMVLIIEDDNSLRESLSLALSTKAQIVVASSCQEAANTLCKHQFDLIIADYQLNDGNGFDLIRSIRESSQVDIPIILITGFATKDIAIDAIELRVVSLIEKPFSLEKLHQVVDKHLKTNSIFNAASEDIVLNPDLRTVNIRGENIELTSIEFKILMAFTENKNKQLQRTALEKYVWGQASENISKNVLDTHLYNLKKKIPVLKEKIRTIHGSGLVYNP